MRPSAYPDWHAVAGWCSPEEADALYEAACALPPDAVVVEVGTWVGRSAIALALGCRDGGAWLTTIDNDLSAARITTLEANLHRLGAELSAIHADALDVATAWEGGPVAFLYIDGWHDAASVRATWNAWAAHVAPGASVWFHDAYGAGWPGVQLAIDELTETGALIFEGYTGTIARMRKGGA
jgi:predicted O-methyltransferase YrrM